MPQTIVLTINEGEVRGFKTKSAYSSTEYYSFLGVPYGQPTAGHARFKDPVKVKPWKKIFDGTVEKEGCAQFSLMKKQIIGSEDCLYNNIYTPEIPKKGNALKAVIVCIHPGGFFHGSPGPRHYGAPDFIMHHDIVYVCVAYRLHYLGFLNLNVKNCNGYQFLKDVILSLQWIKENISVFGGDPENVTLMGSSSGSALVHFILLSPLSKGLYHKAILMGMYVFNPLLINPKDHSAVAHRFACRLGYDGKIEDKEKLHKFYKKLPLETFFTIRSEQFLNKNKLQVFPVTAFFLRHDESSEDSPLPQSLEKLIPTTNRVPLMIGFCEREAAMALAFLKTLKHSISDSFPQALRQNCWGWGADLNDDALKQIEKEVEDFYLDGKPIKTASQPILCDIITDAGLSDVYDSLINVISTDIPSSVYVYNFKYDGKLDRMKAKLTGMIEKELKGAFHASDFCYWCYVEEAAGKFGGNIQTKDREMIETFTSLLTSFAKTNDPNYEGVKVNWKPTSPEHPNHLIINDTGTLEVRDEVLNGERMEFWHKLKQKYKTNHKNL